MFWLKVGDKRFEQKLAALQAGGAVYRTRYRGGDWKYQLVFEQGEGQKREFRVLNFELQITKTPLRFQNQVTIDLAESSKATLRELNALARQGFIVRDLFITSDVWKRVSVLLERTK